jgi:formiminoglutamate deiminase
MTPAGRWWCELAWLGGEDATAGVLLEAGADGNFMTVAAGGAADGATVLRGLTVPGLVNAHSHAFHRALRGRTQRAGAGSFWTWREGMYELAGRLDPDSYRQLATATFAEMVLSGITTVGEFHYLHHDAGGRRYEGDAMGGAIIDAAATAGIRLTLLDTCYLAGGIGRPAEGVQRRFDDGDVDRWAERVERLASTSPNAVPTPSGTASSRMAAPEMVRIGAAIHSVRAVPPAAMVAVAEWARDHHAPLHAHVSEQPAENDDCLAAFGRTPTGLLADQGALGASFTAVHATHLTDDDVHRLGSTGSAVCLCPTTERDLADGIGPAGALRAAGSPICLGSDSQAVIDLWEEARAVELDERLATRRRGTHAGADLLAAATAGGARSLGWDDGGRIAPGVPADFATLRLDGAALAGTLGADGAGAAAAAVFAAGAGEVTDVVIAGRPVVVGGRHLALGPVGPHLARAVARVWEDGR